MKSGTGKISSENAAVFVIPDAVPTMNSGKIPGAVAGVVAIVIAAESTEAIESMSSPAVQHYYIEPSKNFDFLLQ